MSIVWFGISSLLLYSLFTSVVDDIVGHRYLPEGEVPSFGLYLPIYYREWILRWSTCFVSSHVLDWSLLLTIVFVSSVSALTIVMQTSKLVFYWTTSPTMGS